MAVSEMRYSLTTFTATARRFFRISSKTVLSVVFRSSAVSFTD